MTRAALALLGLFLTAFAVSAPWVTSASNEIPAFNSAPPAKDAKLPPILGTDQLWGDDAQFPYQIHAYEVAASIPNVLYQQPCYCFCSRVGHKSLRTCFETTHGARCGTCLKELYYTYQESKKGKTAAEIRKSIIAGDWQQIDLQTAGSTK
jgi:hypothetical protein